MNMCEHHIANTTRRLLKGEIIRTSLFNIIAVSVCLSITVAFTNRVFGQEDSGQEAKKVFSPCGNDFYVRSDSPVQIGYMPLGSYYTLESHADKRIIRYQLGCVVEENGKIKILNRGKEEATDLPPANVSENTFPFTYLNVRQVKKKCSSKGAKTSVISVTFIDGTSWSL